MGAGEHEPSTAELMPLLYDELHELAAAWLGRKGADGTLEPTVLVHEAYLRLAVQRRTRWQNRSHFYAIAAQAMRRVLLDHARGRGAAKRGASWKRVRLADVDHSSYARSRDVECGAMLGRRSLAAPTGGVNVTFLACERAQTPSRS